MRTPRRAVGGGLLALAALLIAGCTATGQTTSPTSTSVPTVSPAPQPTSAPLGTTDNPVRVAIVGDSLTAGGGARLLSEGLDQNTWMTYAQGRGIDYVGGWAKGGTTVETMAANVSPISRVDVLVLMAGTNDVRHHITFEQAAASYAQIVDVIKPEHVLIGAIPPLNSNPQDAAVYGVALKQYTVAHGWDYYDPWGFARNGRYYKLGTSRDGIHPLTRGYKLVGQEFRVAILKVAARRVDS